MDARRTLLSRLWVLGSVAYGGLRALLVWKFLSGYGVDPWVFAVVELASSAGYGWASARLVIHIIDRRWHGLRWSAPATLVAYGAPDAYVLATVGTLPDGLLRTVLAVVTVSAVLAVFAVVREVRRATVRARAGAGVPQAGQ